MDVLVTIIAVLTPILIFFLTIAELILALRRLLRPDKKDTNLEGLFLPWMATRRYVAPPTIHHRIGPAEQFRRLAPWLLGVINLVLGPVALAVSVFVSTGSRRGDLLLTLVLFGLWLSANALVLLGLLIARPPKRNTRPPTPPANRAGHPLPQHSPLPQGMTPPPSQGVVQPDRRGQAAQRPPQLRVRRVTDLLPPPFEWVEIPAGRVEVEDQGTSTVAAFAIARYPITNAQYQVFVDAAEGYRNPQWWDYSREAQAWRAENKRPQDTAFAGDDRPRTNVTWYEAVAFCRWLSAQTGEGIMLPTEQQWQRAAQGDDGREYPWGNAEPNKRLCNWANNAGRTTPVTQYPDGASPYGVMDMSGNVWEWCLNEYESGITVLDGTQSRVLRGGSWCNSSTSYLRAAYRGFRFPVNWYYYFGFRCARSAPG